MISPLINSIIVAGFGFFIGIVLQITMRVVPERQREPHSLNFDMGLRGLVDSANKSAEESREMVRVAGPGFWMVMIAFYGLIAVLILVLIYSPMVMNWPVFLISLFAGFFLFEWIFMRAKEGKISSPSSPSNDSPPSASDHGQ